MAHSSTSNPILVQLLYSGRRNPQRPLDQRAVGEIAGRLRGLPERKDAPEGELGEPAGFLISNPAGGEIPREVRVFDGAITVKEGSEKAVIYSDEKGLEEWLKKFITGELEALSQ